MCATLSLSQEGWWAQTVLVSPGSCSITVFLVYGLGHLPFLSLSFFHCQMVRGQLPCVPSVLILPRSNGSGRAPYKQGQFSDLSERPEGGVVRLLGSGARQLSSSPCPALY